MLDDLWAKADRIPGWFKRDEADLLLRLTDGPWCEVGCWQGRSTLILAETGEPGYAVDWFCGSPEHDPDTDTLDEFLENIGPYENVTVLSERFEDAAHIVPDGLRMLHLDADHSYDATRLAFDLYSPKVDVGGHVQFHDALGGGWPEVERFVNELDPAVWLRVGEANLSAAFKRLR